MKNLIFNDRISKELEDLSKNGRLRVLKEGKTDSSIIVSSNDYLGLANHPLVLEAGIKAAKQYGLGGQSSRLVVGNHRIIEELEFALAEWLGYETALCFNSGYQLNHSVLKAIGDENTLFFIDKLAHNSLIQGCIDSKAEVHRFKHNDIIHLESLLNQHKENEKAKWIIIESVYSMDGDEAKLNEINELAQKYHCEIYLDEAHALGVIGNEGKGVSESLRPRIVVGTFGKAFGTNGAFITLDHTLKQWIINKVGGFIYTTALSPFIAGASLKALELITSMDKERTLLMEYSTRLRKVLNSSDKSRSCIVPWVIGSESKSIAEAEKLEQNGFKAIAIRPPTVPINTSRIRFSLHSALTLTDINRLVQYLESVSSHIK